MTPMGCNPFSGERGTEGQACFENGSCDPGLVCYLSSCHVPADCSQSGIIDCSLPGGPEQGIDQDADGWGECCDCNDGHAGEFPGASEICDQRDNDCDQETDEGNVCPACTDQDGDLYGSHCPLGDDCNDADATVHPGAPETCDARDDDCDGQTDEDVAARACSLNQGVCAGAMQACDPGQGWINCDYGPDYMQDMDNTCDSLDNDCDGQTDEDALIELAEIGPLASDGIDNNCDGLTDEPGGIMVPHPSLSDRWVDAYELVVFENSDCTGTAYGQGVDDYPAGWPTVAEPMVTLYACSLPDVQPSGHLSWYRAERACLAQGKRLCEGTEWALACNGANNTAYPYGNLFQSGTCNDCIGGTGQVEFTGSFPDCTAGKRTFDMSGNMTEWLSIASTNTPTSKMVAGHGYTEFICGDGQFCDSYETYPNGEDWVTNASKCAVSDQPWLRFPPAQAEAWLGARCCWDVP